jgi:tetratricopeptide (TPR) repeat protein
MKVQSRIIRIAMLSVLMASSVTPMLKADPINRIDTQNDLLTRVQAEWANINYQVAKPQRASAFAALSQTTGNWVNEQPNDPAALIWHGIVLSSQAGAEGGLGALSLAKAARDSLEKSLKLDPRALQGSAHTSLATLYSKVPGFPIGFGSAKKARQHFQKALALNPEGIDPNFFYAEFLLDEGEYGLAIEHLERALAAPARPDRELADRGRRIEIQNLMGTIHAKS